MSTEQRLVGALRSVDRVEPSPDLFSRVVHSIDEDRLFRRRIMRSAADLALVVCDVIIVMRVNIVDGVDGRHVRWQVMEPVETVSLGIVVAVLGPAVRRFGRNFVGDLWTADPSTPSALLRLLDLADSLVFVGDILVTVNLAQPSYSASPLGQQIGEMSVRLAGLLLAMSVLHALIILVLPLIALVRNSTRTGRRLPRWVVALLAVLVVPTGLFLLNLVAGLIAIGQS